MKNLVKKAGKEREYYISSSATSTEELGNPVYYATASLMREKGIEYTNRAAVQLKKSDYNKYDLIIVMDDSNVRDALWILGQDKENKVHRLLEYTKENRNVSDPWYTRDFEKSYTDILSGCTALFEFLEK